MGKKRGPFCANDPQIPKRLNLIDPGSPFGLGAEGQRGFLRFAHDLNRLRSVVVTAMVEISTRTAVRGWAGALKVLTDHTPKRDPAATLCTLYELARVLSCAAETPHSLRSGAVQSLNQNPRLGVGPVRLKISNGSRAETGSCRDFVHSFCARTKQMFHMLLDRI